MASTPSSWMGTTNCCVVGTFLLIAGCQPPPSGEADRPRPEAGLAISPAPPSAHTQAQAPGTNNLSPPPGRDSSKAAENSPPQSTFVLGPGMYEMTIPGAEPIPGDDRESSAGVTLTGGAALPSNVLAAEIREKIDQFRAGDTASLGNTTVSWALIVKSKPAEPAPPTNPSARPIRVGSLAGIEVESGGAIHWLFAEVDHSLMISVRGPNERVRSPEIRQILNSLRRTGNVPADVAKRARSQAVDNP
jgi:hypothetical protein